MPVLMRLLAGTLLTLAAATAPAQSSPDAAAAPASAAAPAKAFVAPALPQANETQAQRSQTQPGNNAPSGARCGSPARRPATRRCPVRKPAC